MQGFFISFEGGEGAGKSTQIDRLRQRLESLGYDVLVTREPGGSPKAERIRNFILSGQAKDQGPEVEALLFYAARLDHLEQTIRPALEKGAYVLCDRFSDSTRAYQGAAGRVDAGLLGALERVVVGHTKPDLTFILDVPPEIGLARARRRGLEKREGADRFEAENADFHQKLRLGFLALAKEDPDRCVIVAADREADLVSAEIWAIARSRMINLSHPHESTAHVA